MSATFESDELDFDIMEVISCVAIFYEKGKSGSCFLRKKNFGLAFTKGGLLKGSQGNSQVNYIFCSYYVRKPIEETQESYVRYRGRIGKGHKRSVFGIDYTLAGQCSRRQKSQSWFC